MLPPVALPILEDTGDIIKTHQVRSAAGERPRRLRFYYDTGSPVTFVKWRTAAGMRNLSRLAVPEDFGGLGDGAFQATHLVPLEIRLLGLWRRHLAYVVPDRILEADYDVLLGHDFMQRYNVTPLPRLRDVRYDPAAVRLAQKLRSWIRAV